MGDCLVHKEEYNLQVRCCLLPSCDLGEFILLPFGFVANKAPLLLCVFATVISAKGVRVHPIRYCPLESFPILLSFIFSAGQGVACQMHPNLRRGNSKVSNHSLT